MFTMLLAQFIVHITDHTLWSGTLRTLYLTIGISNTWNLIWCYGSTSVYCTIARAGAVGTRGCC